MGKIIKILLILVFIALLIAPVSYAVQVNGTLTAGNDDAQWYFDVSWNWSTDNSHKIWFGNWNDYPEPVFHLFTLDAAIPDGATIDSAIVTYTSNGDSAVTSAYLYVTESGDASQRTTAAQRPSWADGGSTTTYPATEAHANCIHWADTWPANNVTEQIDIASLVQHLIDTYAGIGSGEHIGVWIDGDRDEGVTDENGLYDYENGSKYAYLTINYSVGSAEGITPPSGQGREGLGIGHGIGWGILGYLRLPNKKKDS